MSVPLPTPCIHLYHFITLAPATDMDSIEKWGLIIIYLNVDSAPKAMRITAPLGLQHNL
jgi:hypothetical protein